MRLFGALEHEPTMKPCARYGCYMMKTNSDSWVQTREVGPAAACMPGTSHANADDHTEEHWRVPREDKDQRRCCF
jgi:hypothetical protein